MTEKKIVRVRDVMTDKFETVHGFTTVSDAIKIMKQHGSDALLVEKRNEDDEYGIVLLSDIAREVLAEDRAPERVNIYEIMSKPIMDVGPNMDIRYCARLFQRFGLSYAPVTEKGQLLGLISYADMVLRGFYAYIGDSE